jgi:hypothetical protein
MKKHFLSFLAGLFVLFTVSGAASASDFDYVIGVEQCPPGEPPPKPEQGVHFIDSCFGTTIVRVSDAETEAVTDFVQPRYAKFSPENSDGTRVLLRGGAGTCPYPYSSYWMLYNVDKNDPNCYSFIKEVCLHYQESMEPRWSGTEPDIFYYTMNMEFRKYNVVTDEDTLVRDFSSDFPGRSSIYMDDEGDSSADSRYWAWFTTMSGKYEVFTYDKDAELYGVPDTDGKTGEILGVLEHSDFITRHTASANWVSMTDDGSKVVVGSDYGTWNTGSYNKDFSDATPLYAWVGHSDTAIDVNGNNVLFGFELAYTDGYGMVDLETVEKILMLRRPWPNPTNYTGSSYGYSSGSHCVAKPGWGLYSAYCSSDCRVGDKFDCLLIFLMELKDVGHYEDPAKLPRVWQVAHHYNSPGYYPWGVMNRVGTRIYFRSNWGSTANKVDTYVIELPETWYEDLSGPLQSCSDQSGHYCTDRETQVCPGQWLYANDTDACCSQPCQPDTEPPLLSVSHSPQNPSETQQVTLTVTASDNVKLKEVKLYLDGQLVRTCSSSPCQNLSGPYPFGIHAYYATAEDYAGNTGRDPPTGEKNFNVTEDIFPPGISNVQSTPAPTSAIITWETDEPANSLVKYGTQPGIYPESETDPAYVTQHSIALTGLLNSTTYYFVVNSTDQGGNPAQSPEYSLTTTTPKGICEDLVLLMHFDNQAEYGENSSFVYDFSDNGNNATCSGSNCPAFTSGNFSGAFDYDGADDWFDISDSATLYCPTITVSAWVNYTGGEGTYVRLLDKVWNQEYVFVIRETDDLMYVAMNAETTDADTPISGCTVPRDVWKHLTWVYDGSTVYGYIDGVNCGSATQPEGNIIDSANPLLIGNRIEGDRSFDGIIDELAIWNRTLSPQEISDLYNSGYPITCEEPQEYHPADTDHDGCITMGELLAFIDKWKMDSQDVPMWEVMEAIGLWKAGTGCL